jgi:proteic killer suppression protein
MIKSFKHNGLKRFFSKGERRRIPPEHADKLERVLDRLDASVVAQDMNLPGYRLHRLKGNLAGHWSVDISGNWRVTFRFEGPDVCDVDYIDYHGD